MAVGLLILPGFGALGGSLGERLRNRKSHIMPNEDHSSTKTNRNSKKIAGIILFWIGFAGIISSSAMTVASFLWGTMDFPEAIGWVIAGIALVIVALLMAIVGAILFGAGKSQEIEQRSLHSQEYFTPADELEMVEERIRKIFSDKGYTKLDNKNRIDVDSSSSDSQWLAEFEAIYSKAESILNTVRTASNGSEEEFKTALEEAVRDLPTSLRTMKETPLPSKKQYQKYRKDVLAGMELFSKGCQYIIEWFKTPEEHSLAECLAQIHTAYSKFNKANIWLRKGSE